MSERKYDPTVDAVGYMKEPNDPPLKPCGKCGAEINANWTIRALQKQKATLITELRELIVDLDTQCTNRHVTKRLKALIDKQEKGHEKDTITISNKPAVGHKPTYRRP